MEQLVQEAKRHEAEDQRRRELVQARNTADSLIYQMEKMLRDTGEKVPASDRQRIEQLIEQLRQAKDGEDTARIQQLTEELQQASYAIGQQMYAQQQAADGGQTGPSSEQGEQPGEGEGDGEVYEGEQVYQSLLDYQEDRIIILAREDTALVNALQTEAAVVVQKSIREGFGLTVTEAMWKGTPVIGGNVGGIRVSSARLSQWQERIGSGGFAAASAHARRLMRRR